MRVNMLLPYFAVVLVLAFVCVVSGGNTNEHTDPATKTVPITEGRDLLVTCNVTLTPGLQVHWESIDRTFYQPGLYLNITRIHRNSTGLYICMEDNRTQPIIVTIETVFVDVVYPATIDSMTVSNTTLRENETLSIELSVDGNPDPDTVLYLRDVVLDRANITGNVTLTVHRVDCEDTGTYTVTSTNHVDHCVASREVNITVLCAPRPDNRFPHNLTVHPILGETTHLEVHSLGFPPPVYSWTQNGHTLLRHTDTGHTSFLTLSNVTLTDYGVYTLRMSNDVGTSTTKYNVQEYDKPTDGSITLLVAIVSGSLAMLVLVAVCVVLYIRARRRRRRTRYENIDGDQQAEQ